MRSGTWERDTNYTNGHEPRDTSVNWFGSIRAESWNSCHMRTKISCDRDRAEHQNIDTDFYRLDPGAPKFFIDLWLICHPGRSLDRAGFIRAAVP